MSFEYKACADVGSVNCPCPLAETGDCIVCSRLGGKNQCDCHWAGVCVYNEYIQNGRVVRGLRQERRVSIVKKEYYDEDLLVLTLDVGKGFALTAAKAGSFVFLRNENMPDYYGAPLSIMKTDIEEGCISLALKIISAKTKSIAEAEDTVIVRGIYRNGLLGKGRDELEKDMMTGGKWLIITKGVGFAPAINLLDRANSKVAVEMIIDTDKICQEIVFDNLEARGENNGPCLSIRFQPLCEVNTSELVVDNYDRIILLTSDYYIDAIAKAMDIPNNKLIFCNNFRLCCGEGICGACSVTDSKGEVRKMCKCTNNDMFRQGGIV